MILKALGRLKGIPVTALLSLVLIAATASETEVEQIIEQYLNAAGGRPALEKIETRVIKGEFSLTDMGIYAAMEMYSDGTNFLSEIDLGRMGSASNGVAGDVAWRINPMDGAKVLSGSERSAAIRQAAIDPFLDWRTQFGQAEILGKEEIEGKSSTKIRFAPGEGEAIICYFDDESHLLARLLASQGGQSVQTDFVDYRPVQGIMIPFKTTLKSLQYNIEVQVESVEFNVPIPEGKFQLPPEIAAKVGK